MLTSLLTWIKQMIYLLVFLTLMLQILPNGNYRKYVKFFAGLIFVVTLMHPLGTFLGAEDWENNILNIVLEEMEVLDDSGSEGEWNSKIFEGTGENVTSPDFSEMEEKQQELYEKYTTEITGDLSE